MERTEIRRTAWRPFLDEFSRRHHGWLVTLGVIDTELLRRSMEAEAHLVVENAVFEGMDLEQRAEGEQIAVVLGREHTLSRHAVRAPRRMFVERDGELEEEGLRVDATDGSTLLMRFRAAAPPEALNGLAKTEA
ncbi:MAG: DUF5335 family protein [Thiohalomonadaceae bacterium]